MIMMIIFGLMLLLLLLLYIMIYLMLMYMNKIIVIKWQIYMINSLKINLYMLFDDMTMIFLMIVTMITLLVMFYSIEYMKNIDFKKLNRFTYLIMLFMISMYMLICMPNMFSILIGWDYLGMISYCLVIYYQNMKAFNAGFLTIMLNRIGDCMLLMMISMCIYEGMLNFSNFNMNMLMLLMIMSFTKSAQIPFSSWLPAAMMAPTPISALVHSSTLVTAGIYLLIRISKYINFPMNNYFLLISSLTMLISGFMANFENDFKKIIALSTLSQLGFMMSILLMNFSEMAFMHLIIHATFKSLMFLCAGSLIHDLNSSQDLQNYTSMFYIYPYKSFIMMFSNFCLCGFPFMAGFYSKDLIMEIMLNSMLNLMIFLNLIVGTIMTVSYSFRLLIILMKFNNSKMMNLFIKDNFLMNLYMLILVILTLFFSYFFVNLKYMNIMINLSLFDKLIIFQLCLIGMMISFMFLFFGQNKNIMLFFSKNMMFLNKIMKMNYNYFLIFSMNYEIYFEKMIMMTMNKNLYLNLMMMIYQKMNMNFFNILNMMLILMIFLMLLN
uniref:NADH-ubiquinone oxidoreductase chain 5 n=1 Tax=Thyreus decorus TaxID=600203 RepID=A0A7U0R6J3_9HYME|nr:NADH dehydrogenase subunit 5 [Thyreus decorus]QQX27980.1 NADH dehydrogenase subunit 5 [Thyreus decorus]